MAKASKRPSAPSTNLPRRGFDAIEAESIPNGSVLSPAS
ncbi:hypothetical protein M673_21795 (plasmid) [Aureimonas sp. AU20]|nr:hypothetical protein M673_21795 [Aureimonas sp. AU20]